MRDLDIFLKNIVANDRKLADEIRIKTDAVRRELARTRSRGVGDGQTSDAVRTIVLRTGRPVLPIVRNAPQLEFADASDSRVWRARLEKAEGRIKRAAQAVGRVEVAGHPLGLSYVGTGWLVEPTTLVTNRHVAREFGRNGGGRFTFATGFDRKPMRPSVDFLEEVGREERREFRIIEILHIEDDDGPDVAFVRVEPKAGSKTLARPIELSASPPAAEQQIAVIGYPARDSRIPDDQLMHHIFGDVYDKKRVAPGQVTAVAPAVLQHDCSTLGGNSGSVLLDLASGEAVGLHFAGRFLEANFAVPAALVAERLEAIRRAGRPGASTPATPLRPPAPARPPAAHSRPPATTPPDATEVFVEGTVEEYQGRTGYVPSFIGVKVPLPSVRRGKADVLTFPWKGKTASELTYEHFSVVMSRSRRMCFFSACNLDGGKSRRGKRPSWRLDPRIPREQQIRDECYGNEPKFSRGHMTRREDPVWGAEAESALGNSDSMHVTNTVPQMQPFNAGIWLDLEDYALEHARDDEMRISVFTGPFFQDSDPILYGIRIPKAFWKVLAFIHDGSGALSATGYTMSQEAFLRPEEFVFAQHRTTQTRIEDIEARAGLSFGPLAAADPFRREEEGVELPLTDPRQIRFV
jgi:endonuclease G